MNVTCLVESDGDVAERYVYNPYGEVEKVYSDNWTTEVGWSASKKNNIRYCGYFFDDESGLYSVRHRYYHPPLGRWLSRDPIGYRAGTNLYGYVRSSPCVHVDPYGVLEARSQPNGPCINACYSAWYGIWLKPTEYVASGHALVREKISITVKDCEGKLLYIANQVMFYYLLGFDPDKGRIAPYFNDETKEYHYHMFANHPIVGPGGKFKGDCTEGVMAVEADIRFTIGFMDPDSLGFGDPAPGRYWPERTVSKSKEMPPGKPEEYKNEEENADKWTEAMTVEGAHEKLNASLKYQWEFGGHGSSGDTIPNSVDRGERWSVA